MSNLVESDVNLFNVFKLLLGWWVSRARDCSLQPKEFDFGKKKAFPFRDQVIPPNIQMIHAAQHHIIKFLKKMWFLLMYDLAAFLCLGGESKACSWMETLTSVVELSEKRRISLLTT